jgi:hypothetical protein
MFYFLGTVLPENDFGFEIFRGVVEFSIGLVFSP